MILRSSGISFNTGADLRMAAKKWYVSTGFDFMKRSYGIGYVYRDGLNKRRYAMTRVTHTSFEVPVQLGIRVHHHEARYRYDVFLAGGMSKGWGGDFTYSSMAGSRNSNGTTYSFADFEDVQKFGPYRSYIFGANVHAVLRKVGLLSYGLEFRYPMEEGPHYLMDVIDANMSHTLVSEPRLPHVDVKLCYYFLSMDKHLRRVRYRK
jgi:hypothetical protein